jgi:PKD repeat protein
VVSTNSSFGVDLGNPNNFPIWCAFYDSLGAEGILSAGATANANYNVDTQGDIPTACPSNFLVSVTNTTNTDGKNNSCGYGLTTIDLGSPGTNVYNTVTNSGYQNLTGTSMATPHVAGAIGLMYAAACDNLISESKNNPAVVATQMKSYLLTGVDPVTSMNGITVTGGRLNVFNALQNVLSYPCDTTQPPNVNFVTANQSGCPGLTVTFNNNTPGNNNTYLWSFPGGNPASSTAENPTVTYNNIGSYDVTLIATNNYGIDTLLIPSYISINNSSVTTIFEETFTGSNFNSLGWSTDNTDGNNTWELGNVAGNSPGNQAAYVNIFSNQSLAPTTDGLISPSIDLTYFSSVTLNFEHAHRRRVASIADSLRIYVSVDGGASFPFRVFSRGGGGNPSVFATGSLLTTSFTPSAAADWCFADNTPGCFTVDLSQFDGQGDVKLRFEIQNNGGNNIYIDNIKLSGICSGFPVLQSPIAQINAQTQTICEKQSVQFQDASQNGPSSWNWTFEGGQPATSTLPNPLVTYNTPGVFAVSLIVSNAVGSDTSSLTSYITVGAIPVLPVISSSGNTLLSSFSTGNQWYLNGNPLNGQTGQSITPLSNGVYTVVYTSPEGCQSTSEPFSLSTSVNNSININFEMFPNPAADKVRIQWNSFGSYTIRLLDLTGRVVFNQFVTGNSTEIDLRNFADGIYLAELSGHGLKHTSKLIHKR